MQNQIYLNGKGESMGFLLRKNNTTNKKIFGFPKSRCLNDPNIFSYGNGFYKQIDMTAFSSSILEDGNINIFTPEYFRLFNSYETSQLLRFYIVINRIYKKHTKIPIKKILDLGCSWSKLYTLWYKNGNFMNRPSIEYWGVDADYKRLSKGRDYVLNHHKKNDKIIHVLADVSMFIDFENAFDVIVAMEIFEHIPKDKIPNLLCTIYKNLSDNGLGIISGENPDMGGERVFKESNHHYEWPLKEITELAGRIGFKIVDFCSILSKPKYKFSPEINSITKRLSQFLPTTITNNIACLLDKTCNSGRQWIIFLSRGL